MFDYAGNALFFPTISIWCGCYGEEAAAKAKEINEKGAELFGQYDSIRKPLYEAFKRLFPDPIAAGNDWRCTQTSAEVIDAIYLYQHASQLPVSFYLTAKENCAFLRSADPLLV